jgi:ATP-dependent DNA helicase RecG
MTDYKLSSEAKVRVQTMVKTNNGFEISETDLKLRGPGDLLGTQQSGVLDLLIADLAKDGQVLKDARESALKLLENDPELIKTENKVIKVQIESTRNNAMNWSRIS